MTYGTRLLLIVAMAGTALVAGCGLLGGDDPDGAASDTTSVSAAAAEGGARELDPAPDSVRIPEAVGADSATGTAAAAQDTSAATPQVPVDSTGTDASPADTGAPSPAAEQEDMSSRLDRLEAENDSLRAAVGVLLNQLSGEEAAPAADTASALLDAGREQVKHWGVRIFISLVFLGLVALVVRATGWLLDRLAERNAARRLFFKRVVPIARIFLWTVALLFVAMVIMEVDAQGLLAAGAAVGVAVGFAAQDILKNVFGGLIVLFDQPFQVGDKIRVGGTYGEVTAIGLRSTRITTPDDNMVSVPNSQVVGDQVSNANAGALNCQVVTDLFLPGDVDEALAKRIAFEAAAGSRYLFRNKPIVVLVKSMFEHTFHTRIRVKAYVLDPRLEFNFESDVTERARAGFREAGIPLVDRPQEAGEAAGVWSADEVAP